MKKYSFFILSLGLLTACKSQYDKAMKSADKDFILQVANQEYDDEKWTKAVTLYERATNLVSGTDDMANVIYKSAYANYYDKQYKLAGHQFKRFSVSFPSDSRTEDAAYMSALCYYKGSMDYNLDQSSTELAIDEMQNFINRYPDSPKSVNGNELINELTYKLEKKVYENAKQYYKMGDYKSTSIAFENMLEDYPSTKLKPSIYDYMMKSKYELAMNSRYDLKEERLQNAIAFSKLVQRELPDTKYSKEAASDLENLQKEQDKFAEEKIRIEREIQVKTERQKRLAEKNKTEQQLEELKKQEKRAMETARDSARVNTPPPEAIFEIKNK